MVSLSLRARGELQLIFVLKVWHLGQRGGAAAPLAVPLVSARRLQTISRLHAEKGGGPCTRNHMRGLARRENTTVRGWGKGKKKAYNRLYLMNV